MADCMICERVATASEGKNPFVIWEFEHSFLVVGDHQYFEGYCVVISKRHAREMHDLGPETQSGLMNEVMTAGKAVFDAYRPWKLNYASLGNEVEHVHWHIFPRYQSDPDHRSQPWKNSASFSSRTTSEAERRDVAAKVKAALGLQKVEA